MPRMLPVTLHPWRSAPDRLHGGGDVRLGRLAAERRNDRGGGLLGDRADLLHGSGLDLGDTLLGLGELRFEARLDRLARRFGFRLAIVTSLLADHVGVGAGL